MSADVRTGSWFLSFYLIENGKQGIRNELFYDFAKVFKKIGKSIGIKIVNYYNSCKYMLHLPFLSDAYKLLIKSTYI